ncbi:MAG TPA: ATPase, T2SS/T4P/T4SS family [Solirubrobacteraceae bacterium]|jgi:type IV pilus assembly protein PilB|nr:ATPase, T2SS/T4P/T4SS family [Solirubrobacteraceae bacterium]
MESSSAYGATALTRRPGRLLGDVAVDMGFATREQVEAAARAARERGMPTGQVLVERKVLRHDQLAKVLAERFGVDYIDLSAAEIDMGVASMLSPEAIRRYQAIPIGLAPDGALLLAMADPANVLTADDVAMITARRVRVLAASAEDVLQIASRFEGIAESIEDISQDEQEEQEETLSQSADEDAPIIKLVHSLIAQAVAQGASDIHITPQEGDTEVELRVDGVLHRTATIRRRMTPGVISRIKIMADLDISERRIPQDGRLALTIDSSRVDIRVVTLPLVGGEGAVMRILDGGAVVRELSTLGIAPGELEILQSALARPHGAVLVTGPTGSGKSTTLYAALGALAGGERSVITIEDPVESRLPGTKQIQVAPRAGMTFATGLRSMLRADPDVIMVGEIRDAATAQISVEAALTGHLLLSTLHTRDAPSALSRLIDMGIEPFLVSAAVDCIVAQRLVRLLCPHCKRPMQLADQLAERYGLQGVEVFEPDGCQRCSSTGYRGRIGVYEVMSMSQELKAMVLERARVEEIGRVAQQRGMHRLRDDGLAKVRAGLTSIAEIERITASML